MYGRKAYVSASHRGFQHAAVVKLSNAAVLRLAFFPIPPTLAVTWGSPQVLHAVWLFSELVQARLPILSDALARRVGGSAAARILVPGTSPDYRTPNSPLAIAGGKFYPHDALQASVSRITRRRGGLTT